MAKRRKPGSGSVHLRKDGRWEGRCVVGYDQRGYPRTRNCLAKTKGGVPAEAESPVGAMPLSGAAQGDRIRHDLRGVAGPLVSDLLHARSPA